MKTKHIISALKELTVEWGNQIHILLQMGGRSGWDGCYNRGVCTEIREMQEVDTN